MRAGITLLPFFAINWFFGILSVEDPENMSLQVIFALTNSMQVSNNLNFPKTIMASLKYIL